MNSPQAKTLAHRRELSGKFLAGDGIEIGALHEPLPVPAGVRVRYVDRLTKPMLRAHYPELESLPLVDVDIVENGCIRHADYDSVVHRPRKHKSKDAEVREVECWW